MMQRQSQPGPGPGLGGRASRLRLVVAMLILGAAVVLFTQSGERFLGGPAEISYSAFRAQLDSGNVIRVRVQGPEVRGELENRTTTLRADGDTASYREFVTYVPSFGDEDLLSTLEAQGVEIQTRPPGQNDIWSVVIFLLPFLLILWLGWIFLSRMRAQGQQMLSVGRSRAKPYDRDDRPGTFDDVAGAEEAKAELEEVVAFLKHPEKFYKLGGEVPKGVLLLGPPGTGKTLLARAAAGEADAPFFSVTGSDFMEMLVGVGASRVRDLFRDAKASAPSIIFIDELDSIGRRRGAGLGGGHDEREQTLNQLLSELDGFEPNENVVVIGATNRPDILDPALLRPGRFDRRITVDLPTAADRVEILKLHARKKPLAEDVDLSELGRATPGFSGADLRNLLNEAALIAVRREHERIGQDDIEAARDKILLGLERRGMVLSDDERRLLAYHEAGHAVVAAVLPHTDPVHKVTIVPRGHTMGATQTVPPEDRYLHHKSEMLHRLAVMMGGRAAERLVFDTATSGAEQDLKAATKLARKMVLDWGMSDELGPVTATGGREEVFLGEELARRREFSDETAREVDDAVRGFLDEAFERAGEVLAQHRGQLDAVVERLLDDEEMRGVDVDELITAADQTVN